MNRRAAITSRGPSRSSLSTTAIPRHNAHLAMYPILLGLIVLSERFAEAFCVNVFTWGHPHLDDGQRLKVNGTFEAVKHVGRYTFHNEIDADEGSL
jgi:hypothetical protein